MATELQRADLIDVLRRTTDPGWLEPLLADPDSAAFVNAMADQMAYLSQVGTRLCDAATISGAPGPRPGTSTVTLSRAASGVGGTIPKGYLFVDARGLLAASQSPVTVASGALTVDVPVATLRMTELVNTILDPGYSVGATNPPAPDTGGTNAIISPTPAPSGYPAVVSTTFADVVSSTNIVNSTSDFLAAHGRERGQRRQANETDEAFRARIRNVPDAVTPAAIAVGVLGAASHANLPPPVTQEPFNDQADASARAPYNLDWFDTVFASGTLDTAGNGAGSTHTDFADDVGLDLVNLKSREMDDLRTAGCYFRVVLPGPVSEPDGSHMFWGDGFFDDPVWGFPDLGAHPKVAAATMAVWEEADRKRAGGVRFDEYIDSLLRVVGQGSTTSAGEVVAFTVAPPAGRLWYLSDGHFGTSSSTPPTGTATSRLRFTFEDGSTYETPLNTTTWTQRVNGPLPPSGSAAGLAVTQVEGLLRSDGVLSLRLVASLFVNELVQ